MNTRIFAGEVLLALLITLAGCGTVREADTTVASKEAETERTEDTQIVEQKHDTVVPLAEYKVTSYPIPTENIYLTSRYSKRCPSAKGGFYHSSGTYLTYQPFGGEAITLCAQAGCTHSDFSCPAYMGGTISTMGEYHGIIYANISTDDEYQIVRHDPATGEHEILVRCPKISIKTDELYVEEYVGLGNIAYGKLYYLHATQTSRYTSDFGNSDFDYSPETTVEQENYEYDLESGEIREVPYEFWCVSAAGALRFVYVTADESDDGFDHNQLLLYDTNTWEATVIADSEHDGLRGYFEFEIQYGDQFVYLCNNTLYTFNVETGQKTELLTPETEVVNFWFQDNKVFYITLDDGAYYYYFVDVTDLTPVQIANKGNTTAMVFSLGTEGNEYFISTQGQLISKEDFYNENY